MSKNKKEKGNGMPDALRYFLFILVVVGVISGIGYGAFVLLDSKEEKEPVKEVVKTNEKEIVGYGIFIDDSDTTLYKTEFDALNTNLTSDEINYDEYAKSIAKMFIIDLYTIKNKINKYDVGGLEFVYEPARENYTTNVIDTIYKYVEDNGNGEREQTLPVVKSINVDSFEKTKFTIDKDKKNKKDDKTFDAYKVKLTWSYSLDLGYDTTGEVIVINDNNKLYVVEKN